MKNVFIIILRLIFYYLFFRYSKLKANSVASPLTTLANNIRMPAMLVAKVVLTDLINKEKHKDQLDRQNSLNNDDSLNSSILNDSSGIFTGSNLLNDSSKGIMQKDCTNDSTAFELDTSSNVDIQLSKQLNWLSSKLLSMRKVIPTEELDQSANSSFNNSSYNMSTATKCSNFTPHQLATSTWLIRSDPQLAYEVFKCSVIDGHYGSCVELIKR